MYNFTLEDGRVTLPIQVGNRMDDTPTSIDWATHGIIACVNVQSASMVCGGSTLTLEGVQLELCFDKMPFNEPPWYWMLDTRLPNVWAFHSDFERDIAAMPITVIAAIREGAGKPLLVTTVLTTFSAE